MFAIVRVLLLLALLAPACASAPVPVTRSPENPAHPAAAEAAAPPVEPVLMKEANREASPPVRKPDEKR